MSERSALIVTDMLSPYDHADADLLAAGVAEIVGPLAGLIARAREAGDVEIVYVNDNHGDYAASREQLVARALGGRHPELVEPIVPREEHDLLIKPRHSAFYGTPLEHLLRERGVDRVTLTGQVTEQCILYTALDAYVRRLAVQVVTDGVAHIDRELGDAALLMMERNMRAELVAAADCC